MATTILQFWQQQLAIYQAEQAAALHDLADAQAKLKTVSATLASDQQAFAKGVSDIATARAQLAVTTIPADATALISTITALMIGQHRSQGAVLDDQEEMAAAQASIDSANATLARATARVATVQAKIATAQAADATRQSYKAAITTTPLQTLKADAATFLGSATVTNATTRLGKNFPALLVTIAGKRRDARTNRLKSLQKNLEDAQDALAAERATDGGLDGTVAQKEVAFQRAQSALGYYVATALDRFGKAKDVMSTLEAIELDATGTVPDVLTDAEKSQVTGPAATSGGVAEPTAESLDGDLNAVFTAKDDLDTQILAAISANVDSLSSDPNVAAKRGAVDTAVTKFKTDLGNFATANKKDLDEWEAIVPDGAWQLLLAFEEGTAALNELSSIDAGGLATTMDSAEDAYATALAAAALAQRKVDYIGDAIALREGLLEAAQAAITGRLLSAIRGDSY